MVTPGSSSSCVLGLSENYQEDVAIFMERGMFLDAVVEAGKSKIYSYPRGLLVELSLLCEEVLVAKSSSRGTRLTH